MWPLGQLSRIHSDGQMHTSISAIQSFRVFMIHGYPVGQLVGSSLWAANILQMVLAEWGKQRGSGEYCRWGTVGSRTFPLIKKETMTLGIPNLWMSWQITRRPLKRNTCQSGGISDQSIWTKRRLFPSHYHLPCSNMASGMKIQRGREKEPCRNGHICTSW